MARNAELDELAQCEREGGQAFLSGRPKTANPHERGSDGASEDDLFWRWRQALAWARGWQAAAASFDAGCVDWLEAQGEAHRPHPER